MSLDFELRTYKQLLIYNRKHALQFRHGETQFTSQKAIALINLPSQLQ